MIHKVGLLPKDNEQQIEKAYKMYSSTNPLIVTVVAAFKRAFCLNVPIEFVGVW